MIKMPQKVKDLVVKILTSHSSKMEVADGLALGMFIGFLPIMGFQMVVSVFVATLIRKCEIAAALAVWVTNPVTFIPIYLFNYWVGLFLYPSGLEFDEVKLAFETLDVELILGMGADVLIPLWIGSCVVGLVMAIISRILVIQFYEPIYERFHKNHVR